MITQDFVRMVHAVFIIIFCHGLTLTKFHNVRRGYSIFSEANLADMGEFSSHGHREQVFFATCCR